MGFNHPFPRDVVRFSARLCADGGFGIGCGVELEVRESKPGVLGQRMGGRGCPANPIWLIYFAFLHLEGGDEAHV